MTYAERKALRRRQLAGDTRNPAAVALAKAGHDKRRGKVMRAMNALRLEIGLPAWEPCPVRTNRA